MNKKLEMIGKIFLDERVSKKQELTVTDIDFSEKDKQIIIKMRGIYFNKNNTVLIGGYFIGVGFVFSWHK